MQHLRPARVGVFQALVLRYVCLFDHPYLGIESVFKQRLKLNAQQPSFCQQGAVLLYQRKEMGQQVRAGDHHRLTKQSAGFSATDVVRHGLVAKIVKAYEERSKKTYGDE